MSIFVGSTGSTTETVVKGSSVSDARATQVFDDVRVSVRSYVLQNDNKRNFVQLIVTKGVDNLHPKLTLLDDVTSWKEGEYKNLENFFLMFKMIGVLIEMKILRI